MNMNRRQFALLTFAFLILSLFFASGCKSGHSEYPSAKRLRESFPLHGWPEIAERYFRTIELWVGDSVDTDKRLSDELRGNLQIYYDWLQRCDSTAFDSLEAGSAGSYDYLLLALVQTRQTEFNLALKAAKKAEDLVPSVAVWRFLSVLYQYCDSGDLINSGKYCDLILDQARRDPRIPQALVITTSNNIGLVYANQGRWSTAENHFLWAIESGFNNSKPLLAAFALNNLGYLYCLEGRYLDGLQKVDSALAVIGVSPDPHGLASIFMKNKLLIEIGVAKDTGSVQNSIKKLRSLYQTTDISAQQTGRRRLGAYALQSEINDDLSRSFLRLAELHQSSGVAGSNARKSWDSADAYSTASLNYRLSKGNEFGRISDLVHRAALLLHPMVSELWFEKRSSKDSLFDLRLMTSIGLDTAAIGKMGVCDLATCMLDYAKRRANEKGYWALESKACSLLVNHYAGCKDQRCDKKIQGRLILALTDQTIAAVRMKSILLARSTAADLLEQIAAFYESTFRQSEPDASQWREIREILGVVQNKLKDANPYMTSTAIGVNTLGMISSTLGSYISLLPPTN